MRGLIVVAITCAAGSAWAQPRADLEIGAVLGARMTSLDGQTSKGGGALKAAGGVHLALPLAHYFEVGAEPGVHVSGSADYRLIYLSAALVARYVRPVSPTVRIRALAGFVPGYMVDAEQRVIIPTDENPVLEWHTAESVARFHVEAIVGIGFDTPIRNGRIFAELRGSRGLITVDADNLAVFNREVGLWVAYAW